MRRKCGLPDNFRMDAICKMPVKTIRVRVPEGWNGLTFEQTKAAWELGWSLWEQVADVKVSVEKDPDTTHIAPTFTRIDGMGGVLAWSEFPCPWSPPVVQKYDSSERYHLKLGEGTGTSLPLLIAHECGHALGIGHGPTGNVMAPYLDDSVNTLGPWDLQEIKTRYDPPPTPPMPPMPPPATDWIGLMKVIMAFIEALVALFGGRATWQQNSGELSWTVKIQGK